MTLYSLSKEADQCVKCGLCLPVCPTYQLYKNEAESPRGRIAIIQNLATEQLKWDKTSQTYLAHCVYCLQCENICPSNVAYEKLIDTTKSHFSSSYIKQIILKLLINPFIFRSFLSLSRFSTHLKLPQPIHLLQLASQIPHLKPFIFSQKNRIKSEKIGLFIGCISQFSDFKALQATISILNQLGYEVIIPQQQGCCGAIFQHMGLAKKTTYLIQKNQHAFKDCDIILTIATGCQKSLTQQLNQKVIDAAVFIGLQDWNFKLKTESFKVALHHPCSEQEPNHILSRLPNITVFPLSQQCCGAGGIHLITEPKQTQQLRQPLIQQIKAFNVDRVITTNSGCRLNLGCEQDLMIQHPIEFLSDLIVTTTI